MRNTRTNRGWAAVMVAAMLMTLAVAIASPAQTFKSLFSFDGTDGVGNEAALVQATDGNFYGTTAGGGTNGDYGTVFKITTSGGLTTLYNFCSQPGCSDGADPFSGLLVQGTDGNFYGTTELGGLTNGDCILRSCGTVFKITPSGTLTTLYDFCSQPACADGDEPRAGLVQGTDGNFYGTTQGGGTARQGGSAFGTVFKITPSGTLTTVYSFCSQTLCTDGDFPTAGLIQASDGNFYGTNYGGVYGDGTVFKVTPRGTLTTLVSFDGTDGNYPYAGVTQGTDGNFYGTTYYGGTKCGGGSGGCGTVYKITPSGTLTTLYSFGSGHPEEGLVQATDGNFYGTTHTGGASGDGTIFKITSSGALTTLYTFCSQSSCTDGGTPTTALVQDTDGKLYGTTTGGGTNGYGTVFSLSVGLSPFVETQPASGKVGAAVKILGGKLEGATAVTFNGTAASFTVTSNSLISAIVPAGATTGPVQVVKPGGTVNSNVNFQVLP
jgi:uncharacterized repeat protein (TIGR03803 family)